MSTLVINLDTATEKTLSQLSAKEGRAKEQIAAGLLARAVQSDMPHSPQEIALLRVARAELPESHWKRYRQLIRKRRAETLTPEEQTELLELGSDIEGHHLERLKAALELSQLWNLDFDETRKLLGVVPRRV